MLSTLFADIAAVLARGNSQAAKVPRWVRHSALWLEQNYDFQYMRRVGDTVLSPLADSPSALDLPNNRVKRVEVIKPYLPNGAGRSYFDEVRQVDPSEVTAINQAAFPQGWWQVGEQILFDSFGIVDLPLELTYYEYTAWPVDEAATPTLLARYENLLFAQSLMAAWRELKDAAALADWTNERDMALRAILNAEEAARYSTSSQQMQPW